MNISLFSTFRHIATILAVSAVAACGIKSINSENMGHAHALPDTPTRVGGDRDAHNCIPSAGYTWSQTLNRCVRIWEVGTRLYSLENPNAPSTDIVIMYEEKDPIELYLATSSSGKPLLMHKAGDVWRDSGSLFSLTKAADGTISLADKMGKIISQSRPKN